MKSVIFDLDGTLVDSQPLQFLAYKTAFKELNLSLNWDEWVNYWVKLSINAYDWASIKNLNFDVEAIRNRKKDIYEKRIITELKPKPGAIDLVNDLKKHGVKLAIASSSNMESIQLIVDKFFTNNFDVLQSDTVLERRKPHPEVFIVTMNKLRASPSETLIIEDSLGGYKAAIKSGGICVVCPDKTIPTRHHFPKAKKIISSLEDLKAKDVLNLIS